MTLALLLGCSAVAQTYTPKRVVIDGPIDLDRDAALHVAALKTPQPVTKEDIEAALGRLADTGLYTDISYKVDSNVLTISLTPSAASMVKPVIFANFVWWQPGELEPLVEARVPNYSGKLSPVGPLTDKVKIALIELLRGKGVDGATIEARIGSGTILSITHPEVLIDKVTVDGGLPAMAKQVDFVTHHLHGEEYNQSETHESVTSSLRVTYEDAGYLDVMTNGPSYGAPHKDLTGYAVDLTASVEPGELYHVGTIALHAAPPVAQSALADVVAIKSGDIASARVERATSTGIAHLYSEQGYWGAKVHWAVNKDTAAHTVAYDVSIAPGDLYHFAGLDVSALPPDQQSAFLKAFHLNAGAPVGKDLQAALVQAAQAVGQRYVYGYEPDNDAATLRVIVKPEKH